MTLQKIFSLMILSLIFTCCVSKSSEKVDSAASKTGLNYKIEYAFITKVAVENNKNYILTDFIQYLQGQKAIEEAIKAGEADTFRKENGDLSFAIPNDYFILNLSNKIRRLEMHKNCGFNLILNSDRTHPINDNSLQSFRKVHADSPFKISLNDDGLVVKVEELFLP